MLAEIDRELSRRSFDYFLKWSRPDWNWDWPHLVKIQEATNAVFAGELENLLVMMPPQHGKTQIGAVAIPPYALLRDPGTRLAIASYNQELANRISRVAKRLAIDCRIELTTDRAAVQEWQTPQGGGVRAVGMGAGLTGNPVDIGIIDDPVKDREEADSEKVRDGHWEWYTDVWLTRNPRHQIMILTPWHHDGLQARVLNSPQAKRWHVIKLPALAQDNDPLGRAPGDALCPDRVTKEELESRRAMNPYGFEALYQCNPTPREGAMFRVGELSIVERGAVPASLPKIIWSDLAASEGKGDYTAAVLVAGPCPNGRYYILDVLRGQWGPNEVKSQIRGFAMQYPGVTLGFFQDPGQAGKAQVADLRRSFDGFSLEFLNATGSKITNAEPLAAQMEGGNVVLVRGAWNSAFIEEFRQFPQGKHDDQVDATAAGYNHLSRGQKLWII